MVRRFSTEKVNQDKALDCCREAVNDSPACFHFGYSRKQWLYTGIKKVQDVDIEETFPWDASIGGRQTHWLGSCRL